jgi:DNA-directed RNA polymerase subunit K/omega
MEKKTVTPLSTITRDVIALSKPVGSIYETVVIIAKRANQISVEIKHELEDKLLDFKTLSDNLEDINENREQVEVSRFFERMPKPTLRAIREFEEGKVYYRNPLNSKITE